MKRRRKRSERTRGRGNLKVRAKSNYRHRKEKQASRLDATNGILFAAMHASSISHRPPLLSPAHPRQSVQRSLPSRSRLLTDSTLCSEPLRVSSRLVERLQPRNDTSQTREPLGQLGVDGRFRGAELGIEVLAVRAGLHRELCNRRRESVSRWRGKGKGTRRRQGRRTAKTGLTTNE